MGTSVRPLPSSSTVVREQRGKHNTTMAELGLKKKEVEAIDFAFDVYDFKGDGNVDAFYTGDLMRACNLNPTLKTIDEIGGEKEKGKKMLQKADVYPIYKAAKDSKDQGGFHDFVEILKLYDKNDDNTMISQDEAKSLMKELCEPADDEGFMPFIPFLERMWPPRSKLLYLETPRVQLTSPLPFIRPRSCGSLLP